ncbi:MAG TPA: SRPBCC family protein [Anaerolineales bacterium]|nr:SRPBCC family protein [Anaerolineales bacterium]
MTIIESSISLNKPVAQVFEFITNLENQKKLSEYVTGVEVPGPVQVGLRYIIKTAVAGRTFDSENEVVALEPNKKFAVKTIAKPPASDVTNTYLLEPEGNGTKLTIQMDTVVMAMGMEEMVKNQLKTGLNTSLAAFKKAMGG